jgi:hypothetical protein
MGQADHQERFPPLSLSDRCGFGEETFARTHGSGQDAPIPAVQLFSDSRGICLVREADGHHRRRPRIACRRLTLITRERPFFLQV